MKTKELLACAFGIIVGGLAVYAWQFYLTSKADTFNTTYHVHADFKIYLGNEAIDLSQEEYMTTAAQELSKHVHLHDNNGDVEHIHLEGVTFAEFLSTLGLTLTNDCLTYDRKEHCSDGNNTLSLFVNEDKYQEPITSYIPNDEDRILVFFGNSADVSIQALLDSVTDDACYFSGTCPERGIAPPESCGLTCEL
jgi:hypothetical protein